MMLSLVACSRQDQVLISIVTATWRMTALPLPSIITKHCQASLLISRARLWLFPRQRSTRPT